MHQTSHLKIILEQWEEKGYANFKLSSENLRDQAASLEKTVSNVRDTIVRSLESSNNEQTGESNLISQTQLILKIKPHQEICIAH